MKKFYAISLGVILLAAVSCNKWLEATSSSQISDEKLFSTRSGFHETLNGLYVIVSDRYCYGLDYTVWANELSSYPYQINSVASAAAFQKHLFNTVNCTEHQDMMWQQAYMVASGASKLILELENHRDVITNEDEYNLIKGEALGLRALMNFEVIRMFGTSTWTGDNAGKLAPPYLNVYSKDPVPQRTYTETATLLWDDILASIECLKSDPLTGTLSDDFTLTSNADGYWDNRLTHMNCYAIRALAARVAMWQGETSKAASYASEAVQGALSSELSSWLDVDDVWQTASTLGMPDLTFACEGIFSMDTSTGDYWHNWLDMYLSMTSGALVLDYNWCQSLYPAGDLSADEDVRGLSLWLNYNGTSVSLNKFVSLTARVLVSYDSSGNRVYSVDNNSTFPVLRLSEMQYIICEDAIVRGDIEGACAALDQVRAHRGITTPLPRPASADDLWPELEKEYYREFIGEGRLFFYLKRRSGAGRAAYVENSIASGSELTYPYPVSETIYGRIQEL